MRIDSAGVRLLAAPKAYLSTDSNLRDSDVKILLELKRLADCAVSSLDYLIEERSKENTFDYKADFKSSDRVQTFANHIKTDYERDVKRGKESPMTFD